MHAEILFEQMKAIVESTGYPLLTSYKVDLYVHTLNISARTMRLG